MPNISSSLPADYRSTLEAIQRRVRQERARVILSANAALIQLYWDIGRVIVERRNREGWGAKVIERLARDLRKSFPGMQGFSIRNLHLMRGFAEDFPEAAIVKQLASQLPWWHLVRIRRAPVSGNSAEMSPAKFAPERPAYPATIRARGNLERSRDSC